MFKKVFLFLLFLFPCVAFAAFPKPTGFVNDLAGVVDTQTKSQLENLLTNFEKQTSIEIAVATLPSLDNDVIENVAVKLFQGWGIGKKDKNNGILFLIAPNERKMRIEVGYGLEGTINDALAGRILDEAVMPLFKAGKLSAGIASGTIAIVKTIATKEKIEFNIDSALSQKVASSYSEAGPAKKDSTLTTIAKILVLIVLIFVFIRHPWLFLLLLSSGRGGGGGGGFGGGFGGFGGGFSGGGGASRGW